MQAEEKSKYSKSAAEEKSKSRNAKRRAEEAAMEQRAEEAATELRAEEAPTEQGDGGARWRGNGAAHGARLHRRAAKVQALAERRAAGKKTSVVFRYPSFP